jgi:mono/diheme cytochrome c family protein
MQRSTAAGDNSFHPLPFFCFRVVAGRATICAKAGSPSNRLGCFSLEADMRMRRILFGGIVIASALGIAAVKFVGVPAEAKEEGKNNAALVKRGEYLVNQVAHCGACHTPRNARGKLDSTRHLQGSAIWFTSKIKFEEWESYAPNIIRSGRAGKWTEDRMIKYLTTGLNDEGEKPEPPMPSYKMSADDARAVTAYLRSLKVGKENKAEKKGEKKKGKKKDGDDD